MAKKVQVVLMDNQVMMDLLETMGFQDKPANEVDPDEMVSQVLKDFQVLLVIQVFLVLMVTLVKTVLTVNPVNQLHLHHKWMLHLVLPGLKVELADQVKLVETVQEVTLVLKAPLGMPDLQV